MAFTSDNRPHVMGDLIAITGTVANGDTSVDLPCSMRRSSWAQMNPLGGVGAPGGATIDGTTVKFADPGHANGGRLFVTRQAMR